MYPFRDGDTFATFRNIIEGAQQEIKELDNDYVLKASRTELEDFFLEKVTIHHLILNVDQLHVANQQGVDVDVSRDFHRAFYPGQRPAVRGTQLDIVVPFEGDPWLWQVRPSTYSMSGYPEIAIRKDTITFSVKFPDDTANADGIRRDIDNYAKALSDAVRNLKNDVDQHNTNAPGVVRAALDQKRKLAESTTGVLANLGIPIKPKTDPPAFAIPVKRREHPIRRPTVNAGKYEGEPYLDEKYYEHILSVLRSMALVIERDPAAFRTLDEENIRTHFLLQLNGHYEGGASGETFNLSGKTDILIRSGDRNVFIAECKFWRGQKNFNDAIDQLLGYLTWRDTKCAILVFNTTKDSTGVRAKMHEAMQARAEHKKTVAHDPNSDSRYVFIKPTEPGKDIIITTQLYDIPTSQTVTTTV